MDKTVLDNIQENGCLSVLKYEVAVLDGKEIEIPGTRWRCALTPLDQQKAQEVLPANLIAVVQALWTPEVIQSYRDNIANQV